MYIYRIGAMAVMADEAVVEVVGGIIRKGGLLLIATFDLARELKAALLEFQEKMGRQVPVIVSSPWRSAERATDAMLRKRDLALTSAPAPVSTRTRQAFPGPTVVFGESIDLSQADPAARPRTVAAETTDRLEGAIKELMREGA